MTISANQVGPSFATTGSIAFTLVVPVFGRHGDVVEILNRLGEVLHSVKRSEDHAIVAEVIFVDDGSQMPPKAMILQNREVQGVVLVRTIELSRNFGQHNAIVCGLREARGEYVLRCNSDDSSLLEHIPQIIQALQEGRADRCALIHTLGVSWISRRVRKLENQLLGIQSPVGTSTLRGYSRRFVNCLVDCSSSNNYILELEDWIGFRTTYIPTPIPATTRGISTYKLTSRLNLFFKLITLRVTRGFQWVALLSLAVIVVNFFVAAVLVLLGITGQLGGNGFVSLALLQVASLALQFAALAMIGLVASMSLQESQKRPAYIVAERHMVEG